MSELRGKSASDPLAGDRWRVLTHWIVVFLPGDDCRTVARWWDSGGEGPSTPEEAAQFAFCEVRETLEESARQGGTPVDEIEVLVFERGRETARFGLGFAFEEHGPSVPSEWRGREADEVRS